MHTECFGSEVASPLFASIFSTRQEIILSDLTEGSKDGVEDSGKWKWLEVITVGKIKEGETFDSLQSCWHKQLAFVFFY